MRKTMSLKQLAANRRNALKSTGPKTPNGRAVSKMNALKHGLVAREVLAQGINRKESGRELKALYQRFWDNLKPVGPVEEMLVGQIVTAHWRLRRALTAEAGEITLGVDQGGWKRLRGPHPALQWSCWEAQGDPIWSMEGSAEGIRLLENWLREVRAAVEQEGGVTETVMEKVGRHLGSKPNSLTRQLEELCRKSSANPEGLDKAALRERNKSQALAFVDRELNLLGWQKAECEKWVRNEQQARQAAAALPSLEVLDKILRYETKLERQIHRALAQLERLQRMRQGEAVPPPLAIEVGEGA